MYTPGEKTKYINERRLSWYIELLVYQRDRIFVKTQRFRVYCNRRRQVTERK